MPKAFTNTLRHELLAAYDRGEGTLAELATKFGVSLVWAWKLSSYRKRTGMVEESLKGACNKTYKRPG